MREDQKDIRGELDMYGEMEGKTKLREMKIIVVESPREYNMGNRRKERRF